MTEVLKLLGQLELGTVSGWVLVGIGVYLVWQGLPKFLDAASKMLDAHQARAAAMEARFDVQIKRLEGQVKAADERAEKAELRHEDCVRQQERLRDDLRTAERKITLLQDEVTGLKRAEAAREAAQGRARL
jgi:predicted  nucleic acid-binding Zn-ribbon protein